MINSRVLFIILITLFMIVPQVEANSKSQIEKALNQELSQEEYELLMDARESQADKTLFELFEDVVEERREEGEIGASTRKYIRVSEKRFKDQKRARKNSEEESAYLDEEEPISVKEPPAKKRRSLSKGKSTKEAIAESVEKEKKTLEDERKLIKEKSKDGHLYKRRKLQDRKKDIYRSSDRRKKIEDYNRTKKKKRFGGARVDDEVEDEGFNTKAFKKKQFGSKVVSEQREKAKKKAEAKESKRKKYGGKMFRRGTIEGDDRKKSMFDE